MEYLYGLSMFQKNYSITNQNNIYNFVVEVINMDDDFIFKKAVIQSIKTNIGMTFYENFKQYVMKKYPIDSNIVILLCKF